ncbi:hypothetical protein Afil01_68310 [Actinorhabdospora filicis]|uniref:Methylamine utilisation protein MauE domain-containing protein n=2 Tax=Actinorhabdospora filicis TaxID=1785913 RepID=A0A9W6WCW2_9ACTN|nr:hypothetical protein Afil01_68310 [Actinorhabdospora filicis]
MVMTKTENRWLPWLGVACRLVLAGVWIVAAALKLPELGDSVRAVQAYKLLPTGMASAVGYTLPFVEMAVGLFLLAGLLTRYAAAVSGLLQIAFIIGISSAWARGMSIDCGCFGNGGELTAGQSPNYFWDLLRDVGLLIASAILVLWPRTPLSVDRWIRGE